MNIFLLCGQAAWIPETKSAREPDRSDRAGYGTFPTQCAVTIHRRRSFQSNNRKKNLSLSLKRICSFKLRFTNNVSSNDKKLNCWSIKTNITWIIGTSVGFGNLLPENLSGHCFHGSTSIFLSLITFLPEAFFPTLKKNLFASRP